MPRYLRHLWAFTLFTAGTASAQESNYDQDVAERRAQYLTELYDNFSAMDMVPEDGRRWALNHTRLMLNRDLEDANAFFANTGPVPADVSTRLRRTASCHERDSPTCSSWD